MNAADRAGQLTKRLLSFARRQMLRPQEVRVGDVMDNIERLIGPLLPESIQFSVRGRAMQTAIQVDQGLLEASLLNLIVNARDAVMSEGDGRRRRIVFFAETDPADDTVTFGVRDDGPGIPESVRERMFEPFFTTKEGGAGSGLGLSMALGFAQQSGGSIDVVSEPGSGADVRLKLPTVHKHAPGPANNNDTDRAHDHLTAQGQVVLLVEDEPDLRSVATDRLEQYGFQVISVPTADAGLKALEDRARIDLVVSDLVTPGAADGMEVLERARETHPKAGRIAITGYSERLSGAATKHKDLSVLIKPFTQRDLARAIDTARNAADERFAAE
jgi:CheY-like chemotaxis protein